ncbi:hypothetical protein FK498_19000, partial [Elioraea sp. Yellowstone]
PRPGAGAAQPGADPQRRPRGAAPAGLGHRRARGAGLHRRLSARRARRRGLPDPRRRPLRPARVHAGGARLR